MSCGEKIVVDNEINPQVFIIMQLQHRATGQCIFVVCLHLKSKVKNSSRREAQIKIVLDAVKTHIVGSGYRLHEVPLLMCGDFNGELYENFHKIIVEDKSLNLKDAYTTIVGTKEPTTIKYREETSKPDSGEFIKRGIDYIFHNPNVIKLVNYLELPKNEKSIEECGLPNLNYSSDHLSLVCDFKFVASHE